MIETQLKYINSSEKFDRPIREMAGLSLARIDELKKMLDESHEHIVI